MTPKSKDIGLNTKVDFCIAQGISFCLLKLPCQDHPKFYYGIGDKAPLNHDHIIVQNWEGQKQFFSAHNPNLNEASSCVVPAIPGETSFDDYANQFNQYLEAFENTALRKAILSRIKNVERPENFDVNSAFETLCASRSDACVYILNHPKSGLWMGASPEILLTKNGDAAQTVSLAGTQKKQMPPYTWKEKEREEQALVSEHIRNVIHALGLPIISEKGPYTAEAGNVAHLKTEFHFGCNQTIAPLSIVQKLHPTPAIAGLPVDLALKTISTIEQHKRQLYTGFIGHIGINKNMDIYVNLRCMQIHQNQISLYVGGGITSKSILDLEWNETEEKAKTLLKVIYE